MERIKSGAYLVCTIWYRICTLRTVSLHRKLIKNSRVDRGLLSEAISSAVAKVGR